MIAAIIVNGLLIQFSPKSPKMEHNRFQRVGESTPSHRAAGFNVSSTHSIPNAQPPITSLGQWTPSITRLVPIISDRTIAAEAAARLHRVPAVNASETA